MNKKQRDAKRKNAQSHQKKSKELNVQRENALTLRWVATTESPKPPPNETSDVFEEFFARHLEQGSEISMTSGLGSLVGMGRPFSESPLIDIESTFPIIGRKCS